MLRISAGRFKKLIAVLLKRVFIGQELMIAVDLISVALLESERATDSRYGGVLQYLYAHNLVYNL